jgi:hypothetical protein
MTDEPRNERQQGHQAREPAKAHHGSTAEETAALNETLKAFAKKYYEPNQENATRERKKFRLEIALGIGVALNILLTVGILISSIFQTRYNGDQVTASQGQLQVMGEQEKLQLRAYVGVTEHGIENFGESNQVLRATIKNYGSTPATDVFAGPIRADVLPVNSPFGPTLCIPAPAVANTTWIYPTEEFPLEYRGPNLTSTGKPISKQQIDLVRDGSEYRMLYWGVVYYKDVFGGQRCARYCWQFGGQDMSANRAGMCLQHNDGM